MIVIVMISAAAERKWLIHSFIYYKVLPENAVGG